MPEFLLSLFTHYLPIYLASYFGLLLLVSIYTRLTHRLFLEIEIVPFPASQVPEQLRQQTEKLRLVAEKHGYHWLDYYCMQGLTRKQDVLLGIFKHPQHSSVSLSSQAFVSGGKHKVRNKRGLLISAQAYFEDGSSLNADNSLINFSSFDSKLTSIKCPGAEPAELVAAFETFLAETPRNYKVIDKDGEFAFIRAAQRRSIEAMIDHGAYKLSADGKSAIPRWKFLFISLLKNNWPFSYFFRVRTALTGKGKAADVERINPGWSDSL